MPRAGPCSPDASKITPQLPEALRFPLADVAVCDPPVQQLTQAILFQRVDPDADRARMERCRKQLSCLGVDDRRQLLLRRATPAPQSIADLNCLERLDKTPLVSVLDPQPGLSTIRVLLDG